MNENDVTKSKRLKCVQAGRAAGSSIEKRHDNRISLRREGNLIARDIVNI
ncbi:hypothetical protein X777_10027 [Ooceraea biroi]|uniref:Uncharacterized protein n=1 Tax=Ooceraea biroi TaxID=2015173 RepID=A0A026W5J0_OOCBI|nr:hypothetical protein X777_10027 [Ooceraea biroi]